METVVVNGIEITKEEYDLRKQIKEGSLDEDVWNERAEHDWIARDDRCEKMYPRMRTFLERLSDEVIWGTDMDGLSLCTSIKRHDGNRLDITFSIWDSGDADDGIDGLHGNFILNFVEEGGAIVGNIIPENYSDNVWLDYVLDDEEWEFRMTCIENSLADCKQCIKEWTEKAS